MLHSELMKFVLKTMRVGAAAALLCLLLALSGCGSDNGSEEVQQQARDQAALEAREAAAQRRQRLRQVRRAEARERREAARRRARRAIVRERAREEAEALAKAEAEESIEAESSECDSSYSGACLDPYASDYDCEGGSGDGPEYTGSVAVIGDDHYGLDSDSDGYGCE
jgi:hypothetical protein